MVKMLYSSLNYVIVTRQYHPMDLQLPVNLFTPSVAEWLNNVALRDLQFHYTHSAFILSFQNRIHQEYDSQRSDPPNSTWQGVLHMSWFALTCIISHYLVRITYWTHYAHRNPLDDKRGYIILYYFVESFLLFKRPIFVFCATIRKPFLANIYEKPLHIVVVATSHLLTKVNIAFLKKK